MLSEILLITCVATCQFGGGLMGDPDWRQKIPNFGRNSGLGGGDDLGATFLSPQNTLSLEELKSHNKELRRKYALAQVKSSESKQQYIKKDTVVNLRYNNGYDPISQAEAERMRIENQALRIRTRWEIQDENFERLKKQNSYLDRLDRRIEALERSKELTERYRALTGHNP